MLDSSHPEPPMSRILPVLLACLLLVASAPLGAWSDRGHRLVVALAEAELAPATRAAALALLDGEADTLEALAGWADQAREMAEFAWSRPLHFVNLPRDCSYDAGRDCPGGQCIVAAVDRFAAELADRSLPRRQRALALKFLLHLVADLHQPLHAGFGDDRGGNRYQVQFEGRGTNLHAVWDAELPRAGGLGRVAQLEALRRAGLPAAGTLDPADWARQSCRLIGGHALYPSGHVIGRDYLDRHRPLAEAQLRLAASRLAAVLERALGSGGE
jgi:nuclease S1